MEILSNDIFNKHFRMSDIVEMVEGRNSSGLTIKIGDEMLKNPHRFILYCLSLCPLTTFYFDGRTTERVVIDGNKRLRTILNYIDNQFPLEDGTYYRDLPGYMKARIKSDLKLEAYIIISGNTDAETLIKYIRQED